MELSYTDQIRSKKDDVLEAFLRHGFGESSVKRVLKECVRSPQTLSYRNKAKWILQRAESGDIQMGIYRAGTHDVVDIPECSVHAKAINEVSLFIKERLQRFRIPIEGDSVEGGCLRYIIVRYSFFSDKLMVVFVTSAKTVKGLSRLVTDLRQEWSSKLVAIVQNINDDTGNVLLGEANRFLMKQGELTERLGSFRVGVGPLSFLQVNSRMATKLYKRVQALIGKGPYEKGLDLYSGIGLMGMHQSKTTDSIVCVEEVGPAALDGVTAARRSKISNVLHLCADALEGIQSFQREWGSPDWVILNPPRKGCEAEVLRKVAERSPKRIVYVSCNPETLARDTALLMEAGSYRIKAIEPFDMFPQTAHVETILCLERVKKSKKAKAPVKKKLSKKASRASGRRKRSKTLH